jgi:hypothetical protein
MLSEGVQERKQGTDFFSTKLVDLLIANPKALYILLVPNFLLQ